uniref:acyltransferase family protein n=1 Tax=Ornithinicoccus halotolerans TaxID=1748220 RepID=UPI00129522E6
AGGAGPTPRKPRRYGPSDLRPRPGQIPGLDGIRALAILGVLVFHFTPTVLPGGFLGVDVFFVVSGFLITTLLLRDIHGRGRIDLLGFWLRRARRLLPALVTVVVVSVAAARVVGGDLLVAIERQALGALTFSTNWLEINAGASYFHSTSPLLFVNFWSLAVEEQFYLLWPLGLVLLLALARDTRQRLYAAGGLAAGSALLMALLYTPGEDATRVYYGTDTHLFGLMLGVGLALAWAGPHRAWLRTRTWRRWRGAAVVTALLVLVGLMRVLGEASAWTFRGGMLLACLATVVLVAGLLESPGPWRTLMQLAPLAWLGRRSYAIYLWHWPVLMIAAALFPFAPDTPRGWTVLGGCLLLTLLLAELSHHLVETPVRRHGFLRSLRRLAGWFTTPWQVNRLPRLVAGAAGVLVLLAGVALATAPEKSETQRAIEASEAELVGEGAAEPGSGSGAQDEGADGERNQGSTDQGEGGQDREAGQRDGGRDGDGAAEEDSGQAKSDAGDGGRERPEGLPEGAPASWRLDADGLAVPRGEDITAIGDSLVVTSADGLKHRFPGISFEAKSNRQWRDALGVLEQALAEDRVRDNVIVHFGTNAGVDAAVLEEFLDMLGEDRRVVLMNLYSSSTFVPGSNQAIEQAAAGRDNVVVGDWAGAIAERPEDLQSDRVHPDIPGMHVYAEAAAEAFDALARGG